jgi:glycine/D-amino acid oxidase-like deaminating enzyme
VSLDIREASTTVKTAEGEVVAKHVVIAGGGYLAKLIPALERAILPIATYVMVTEPLGDVVHRLIPSQAAIYDTRFAFDYYRKLKDTRILWGGRISIRDRSPEDIAVFLKQDMVKVFPSLANTRVDYAWGGMMSYARHKMPQIGRLQDGVWYCMGFGGFGMAATSLGGRLVAGAIADGDDRIRLFAPFGLAYAGGRLAPAIAQFVYWGHGVRDWWRARRHITRGTSS